MRTKSGRPDSISLPPRFTPCRRPRASACRDGKRLVTDGPFAETREQLGGYFIVDVRDLDEAIDLAGRLPGAHLGTVEIRPIMEIPGLPTH